MRSLFLKVFLLIFLSTAALGGIGYLVLLALDREIDDRRVETVYKMASEAAHAYETMGRRGLNQALRGGGHRHRTNGFLLDDSGRPIGRPVPPRIMSQITRFPQQIDPGEHSLGPFTIQAVTITSETGQNYRFIALQRGAFPGLWLQRYGALSVLVLYMAIALLASALIAMIVARPLAALRDATRRFAHGELSSRAPQSLVKRSDSMGALAREFDDMAAKLERLVSQQQQLLRDVSHELRSPLARMQVAATLVNKVAEEDRDRHVARILHEIEQIDDLVGRLGLLTLLQEDGENSLDLSEFELTALVSEVVEDARYEAQGQNKTIRLDKRNQTSVVGDREKIRSAVENVVRNAVRYADERGVVAIQITDSGTGARIVVQDDGTGVPSDQLDRIFEPFYRADPARSTKSGGRGVGLSISRAIVLAHGGSIEATNRTEGGLEVEIFIPRHRVGQGES